MKIVQVQLEITPAQTNALMKLQGNGSGVLRERSLAILHCASGKKITYLDRPSIEPPDFDSSHLDLLFSRA